MAERVKMEWVDDDGRKRKLYSSGAARLKYVAERSSATGRFQMPAGQPVWNTKDIRQWEDLGLWRVTWLEEGDTLREGAWRVEELTERGAALLAAWERRGPNSGAVKLST